MLPPLPRVGPGRDVRAQAARRGGQRPAGPAGRLRLVQQSLSPFSYLARATTRQRHTLSRTASAAAATGHASGLPSSAATTSHAPVPRRLDAATTSSSAL